MVGSILSQKFLRPASKEEGIVQLKPFFVNYINDVASMQQKIILEILAAGMPE